MHIIFNHGQESGPMGTKIRRMVELVENRGYHWSSIDYRDLRDEPDARVERLLDKIKATAAPCLLVGSSMGGYVATVAAARAPVAGLFLLAPALYLGGRYSISEHRPQAPVISVVHGWRDDIIPWEHSLRFAQENHASLHLLDDEHPLSGDLGALARLFKLFLDKVEAGLR